MAVARYWRITRCNTPGPNPLELKQLELLNSTGVVPITSVIFNPIPPTVGTLADLTDGIGNTPVRWNRDSFLEQTFKFSFDFGVSTEITIFRIKASDDVLNFCYKLQLEFSDDLILWFSAVNSVTSGVMPPGPNGVVEFDFSGTTLSLDFNYNYLTATTNYYARLADWANSYWADGGGDTFDNSTPQFAIIIDGTEYNFANEFAVNGGGADTVITEFLMTINDFSYTIRSGWVDSGFFMIRVIPSGVIQNYKLVFKANMGSDTNTRLTRQDYNFTVDSQTLTIPALVSADSAGTTPSVYSASDPAFFATAFSGVIEQNIGPPTLTVTPVPQGPNVTVSDNLRIETAVFNQTGTLVVGWGKVSLNDWMTYITDNVELYAGNFFGVTGSAYVFSPQKAAVVYDYFNGYAEPDWQAPLSQDPNRFRLIPGYAAWWDYETGGLYKVNGTVKVDGSPDVPIQRYVYLFTEPNLRLIRSTISDATTGAYSFNYLSDKYKYTVISYDYEKVFRAVIADNLTPEAMP